MAKKSKKRQLEADSNVDGKTGIKNPVNPDSPNKKIKLSPEKSPKKGESPAVKQNNVKNKESPKKNNSQDETNKLDVKASNNTTEEKKLKKKNKKKAQKQKKLENAAENKTAPSDSIDKESKEAKRKEFILQKRAEFKEKRKELRHQGGLPATLSKLSLTQMKDRIAEIEKRETITKTAVRRLRILKKKVQVLESGGSAESVNEKDGSSENISKGNKKDKLQNQKNVKTDNNKVNSTKGIDKKNKKKEKSAAKDSVKNLFIVDRVGDRAQGSLNDSNEEKNGLKLKKNMKKLKTKMSVNSNIEKNNKNKSDSDKDDDQDTDEDGDQDTDDNGDQDTDEDTNEDIDEDKNGIKEETNDSDENDDDSNESETAEKLEIEKEVPKTKKAQNKSKKDSNKSKANPTEADPNKKQRYVLFVGNVAYETTTVDLKKHFLTKVEKIKDVRIPLNPGTNKPRGFAYVEVENSEDYEKALSLHHTFVNGRQLKVEYTTSGSKKASRNPEVIHKNKKLHALRKDGKLAGSQKFSNKRSFRRNFKNNPNKGPGNFKNNPNRGPGNFKNNPKKES